MRLLSYDNELVEKKIKEKHPNRVENVVRSQEYIKKANAIFNHIRNDDYEEYRKQLVARFKLCQDHLKLLKHMEFLGIHAGDTVSIGVDGKRPFGGSWPYKDVAKILGWKLPNDDLSDEQYHKAVVLMDELPLALNAILDKVKWNHLAEAM